MLSDVYRINWTSYAQPDENSASSVPDAIQMLATATEANAEKAYYNFLYAIGNDHCGIYYPVVLPTIPFLGALLESAKEIIRVRVLDVLIDLVCSFEPQPGFETVATAEGPVEVQGLLLAAIKKLVPTIEAIKASAVEGAQERSLAEELLAGLASVGE